MAYDTTTLNLGSGGDAIADEKIDTAGTRMPVSKVVLGDQGITEGAVSRGNPMPVVIDTTSRRQFAAIQRELETLRRYNTGDVGPWERQSFMWTADAGGGNGPAGAGLWDGSPGVGGEPGLFG